MKNRIFKKLALGLSMLMVLGSLSACGNTTTPETDNGQTQESSSAADPGTGSEPAAPADNNSQTSQPQSENKSLVVGYMQFASKFSPFFANLAYDQDVASLVSIGLLGTDREGNVVLKGIEGETIPYNGTDYLYDGIADCEITEESDGKIIYDFTLRQDVKFSDGVALTADDVIFSMYVYSDPTYDGGSVFYTLPITGMEAYRSGVETKGTLIYNAGEENTDYSFFTEDEQKKYWDAVPEVGAAFAQDIINYCVDNYPEYLEMAANNEVALGMMLWGFGEMSEDETQVIGGGTGEAYDLSSVSAADYWNEIYAAYAGDIAAISDTETANTDFFTLMNEAHPEFAVGVTTGESAPNIEGIEKTGDYGVRVTMDKFDATAIYQLPVTVAPLHYYGDTKLYDYDNNQFGFPKGDLSIVKDKTTKPLGAGPYKFDSYENGVVTFSANPNYYKGMPKIQTVMFKETPDSDKLTGIVAGTFDIADPSMNKKVLEAVKGYNSNGSIVGDVLTTQLVDFLGYGYIGISANNVKVGNDKGSEASKNLRKAFATVFAAYRDTVINSYYGEMAAVIQYPISNTSWAAPKPADDGYTVAYSKDVEGNPIYTANMNDEQKYEAALNAAVGFLKAAGYTYDEATGMFTAAPAGAEMTYEVIVPADGVGDHPAFGILTASKEALAKIGITLEINDPSDSSVWNNALEANTAEMWAGAWDATVDPDMYQVYHSDNSNGKGTNSNHYAIEDKNMDQMILAARESADQSYRKATYKECLETILDWGVEIPDYQRQDAIIFSTQRVNMSTVTPDITTYWGWMNDIEKMEMN